MTATQTRRVLKANTARELGTAVAFNFEDLKERCDRHVENVRRQTRKMIEDAQAEAASIRQRITDEARSKGYAAGIEDAEAEIERRAAELSDRLAAEKLSTVFPAMQQAAEQMGRERDRWLAEWEASAIRLSVAIAERLLTHELQSRPNLSTDMIRSALQLVAGVPRVRLRLNPADIEKLGVEAESMVRAAAACEDVTLVPDDAIAVGGCVVESQYGSVDARVQTLLDRISAELIDESSLTDNVKS